MNHIIQLVHVKVLMKGLSPINFYLQSPIFQILLILMQQFFVLVEMVSSLTIYMKLQRMLHPILSRITTSFQLLGEIAKPIKQRGFYFLLLFFLNELISNPLSIRKQLNLLIDKHFSLFSSTSFLCLLEVKLIGENSFTLFFLKLLNLLNSLSFFLLFGLWLLPSDLMSILVDIELSCKVQNFILNLNRNILVQLSFLTHLLAQQTVKTFLIPTNHSIFHLSLLFLQLLFFFQFLFKNFSIYCQFIRQPIVFEHIVRRLNLVINLLFFLTIKSQTVFLFQFLHLLLVLCFLFQQCCFLVYFLDCFLLFNVKLQVIKRIQDYFCSSYNRRVHWPILCISIKTLHCHQIIYRITCNFAENCMLFVQMFAVSKSNEELRAICIFSSIRHSNYSTTVESQTLMKLVLKRKAINRLSS